MEKFNGKWWNEQSKNEMKNETLEGLSTSVRYTKWTSSLAYDEMNNKIMKWTMKWWNPTRVK